MGDLFRLKRFEENFNNSCKIIQRELRTLESANGNMNSVIVSSVEIESELMEAESFIKVGMHYYALFLGGGGGVYCKIR